MHSEVICVATLDIKEVAVCTARIYVRFLVIGLFLRWRFDDVNAY